jgi:hypothetical protein
MRTAENWMLFAESILARAQADAASSPLLLGTVELSGSSHDSILQLVPEVMDGKGMMRFMRETRLLRPPERPRYVPRTPVSARETSKEKSAQARRYWESILTDLDTGGNILARIESTADLERYLDMLIDTGNKIRALLKKRSEGAR